MPSDSISKSAPAKNRISGILKITFGIIWAIIAAEFFLRIFAPVPMLPRYVASTDFGIRGNMANQNYWHRTPDYEIQIRTNNMGIRANENIPYKKPPGEQRIVVLGDSFGMGYGVNIEDTFLNQMNARLQETGYSSRIVNLSVSGHGTAEELLMLRNIGMRFDPDLILVAWHETDLENNTTSNLFALEDGQLVRRNMSYLPAARAREFLFSFAAYRWMASNSNLYTLLRERAALITRTILAGLRGSTSQSRKNKSISGITIEDDDGSEKQLAIALLQAIEAEGRQNDAPLVILDIPKRISLSEFTPSFPTDKNGNTYGLRVVNPTPIFQKNTDQLLYWENSQGHFTPFGCQLVGEALAQYILTNNLLEDSSD